MTAACTAGVICFAACCCLSLLTLATVASNPLVTCLWLKANSGTGELSTPGMHWTLDRIVLRQKEDTVRR